MLEHNTKSGIGCVTIILASSIITCLAWYFDWILTSIVVAAITLLMIVLAVEGMHENQLREAKETEYKQNKRKAQQILEKDGEITLDEYLFLFPNACSTCRSRHLVLTERSDFGGGKWDGRDVWPEWTTSTHLSCKRCGSELNPSMLSPYISQTDSNLQNGVLNEQSYYLGQPYITPRYTSSEIKVSSPYLTFSQEAEIPDF